MSDHITVIAYPTVAAGNEAEFLQVFGILQEHTRSEAGCIDFRLHRSPKEHLRFAAYEVFENQQAFDDHLAAAHTKVFVEFMERSGSTLTYDFWNLLPQPAHATP